MQHALAEACWQAEPERRSGGGSCAHARGTLYDILHTDVLRWHTPAGRGLLAGGAGAQVRRRNKNLSACIRARQMTDCMCGCWALAAACMSHIAPCWRAEPVVCLLRRGSSGAASMCLMHRTRPAMLSCALCATCVLLTMTVVNCPLCRPSFQEILATLQPQGGACYTSALSNSIACY